jgi:hypothetical protein
VALQKGKYHHCYYTIFWAKIYIKIYTALSTATQACPLNEKAKPAKGAPDRLVVEIIYSLGFFSFICSSALNQASLI